MYKPTQWSTELTFDDNVDVDRGVSSVISSVTRVHTSLVTRYRRHLQHARRRLMTSTVIAVAQLLQHTVTAQPSLTSSVRTYIRKTVEPPGSRRPAVKCHPMKQHVM